MYNTNKNYTNIKAFLIARVPDPSQHEALPVQKYKLTDYAVKTKNYAMANIPAWHLLDILMWKLTVKTK